MIKRTIIYFTLVCIAFVLLSNFTILNDFLPNCTPYKYCSDQCRFLAYEVYFKGFSLEDIENSFAEYKLKNNKPEIILYRRFNRKWWQIWNWYDFIFHRRWEYPYAQGDEST